MINRHDVLYINENGRKNMADTIRDSLLLNIPDELLLEMQSLVMFGYMGTQIPVIARRNELDVPRDFNTKVPVGLSSPYYKDEQRLRIPGWVDRDEIEMIIEPFDIVNFKRRCSNELIYGVFEIIQEKAEQLSIDLGIWGSLAMEFVTGIKYMGNNSDIDIIIRDINLYQLTEFMKVVYELEKKYLIYIDAEIRLSGGLDIKAKEIFSNQEQVLGKDRFNIINLERKKVIDVLRQGSKNFEFEGII